MHNKNCNRKLAGLVFAMMAVSPFTGCGTDDATDDTTESHTELASDPTGAITVAITQCAATALKAGEQTQTCLVAPGFTFIGGGAQVESMPAPGDLLQESAPGVLGWDARARDLVESSPYTFRSAAIGLRLNGVSQAALNSMRVISHVDGPTGHLSTAVLGPPDSSFIVIGGGANSTAPSHQHYLVASMPITDGANRVIAWSATSKDHVNSDLGHVTTFAVSIPRCPPGFTGGCLTTSVAAQGSDRGTGYRVTTMTNPGAVTGVGAQTLFTDVGRLLTAIWPTDTGISNQTTLFVSSKDHIERDTGSTLGFQVFLRATPN